MDEAKFWSLIETAWKGAGGKEGARKKLAAGELTEEAAEDLAESAVEMVESLGKELGKLPAKELIAFDRILERKLYEIDRAEIQEHTDGSDDGFMYARGFIVAAGKAYYDAVNAKPQSAMSDLWCEEMCYVSWHLYQEKYGEIPDTGISRESCSNKAAWPGLE